MRGNRVSATAMAMSATLATGAAGQGAQAAPAPPAPLAIENVTVIPMDRERSLPNHTVVVVGRRIAAVGPAGSVEIPADAVRVDGAGRYLLPGLAEMHGHPPSSQWPEAMQRRFLELNIAAGVTTVRGMLGDPVQLDLRRRVANGELLGPQLLLAAPSLNGNATHTAAAASEQITRHRAAGYDLLKVHPGLDVPTFDAIMDLAQREGLPVGGHISEGVGLRHSLEKGIGSVEHLDGFVEAVQRAGVAGEPSQFFGVNKVGTIDASKIGDLVALTKRTGAYVTPTQSLFVNLLGAETPQQIAQRPEMKYWPAQQIAQWVQQAEDTRTAVNATGASAGGMLAFRADLIGRLRDAGVPFLLGADAPQIFNVPGFATLFELETMVDAGLSPWQALLSGTVNPARFMGLENAFGTIAPGMRADLLLLDANPLEDIRNIRRTAGVVVAGRWVPADEIADILRRYAEG